MNRTVAAEGSQEDAVLQADTSLQVALKHKDAKAAGALLDQDFTWTNESGMTRKKAQFLTDAASGALIGDTEYNVKLNASPAKIEMIFCERVADACPPPEPSCPSRTRWPDRAS